MPYDVVSFGETMLRLTPSLVGRLEEATTFDSYVAGTESNTLACLARLGLRCAWLSALPSTPLGRRVAGTLQRHGVDTSHVVWAGADARLGTFYAEEAARPLGTQVTYDRSASACAMIDPDQIDPHVLDGACLLHLTGITPALSSNSRAVFDHLLHYAQANSIPISFDVNYRAKLWKPDVAAAKIDQACHAADVLLCTRDDAADLWGFGGDASHTLHQLADRFSAAQPHKTIVLTLGSDGAAHLRDGVLDHAPAYPTDGTSRFGSGDAFAAGYLYAYLDGPHMDDLRTNSGATALNCGNAAAALKRSIAGDIAIITWAELAAVVRGSAHARFR